MKRHISGRFGLKLILLSILVSGCATSGTTPESKYSDPISMYSGFDKNNKNLGTIEIVADAVIAHDVSGDTDAVVIDESKQLSQKILDQARDYLKSAGYSVGGVLLSSVGDNIAKDNGANNKSNTFIVKKANLDEKSNNISKPPFYIADQFNSSQKKQGLNKIFLTIELLSKTPDKPDVIYKIPKGLFDNIHTDKILFITSFSREVGGGKQFGEMLLSSILTFGTMYISESSYSESALAILDKKSGEIIWSDKKFSKGMPSTPSNIMVDIKHMLKNIPPVKS